MRRDGPANRDHTAGLDTLVEDFLPRLRAESDRLRSMRGQLLTNEMKRSFAAIEKQRIKARNALSTQEARDWFDRLSNNAVAIESASISRHATAESWAWRARVSEGVLRSRIAEAERFPEDESRCREALLDGIAEIDAHAMCHHHDDRRTAARTRRFKSDFAIGRLKGLAQVDPMKASDFFQTAKDTVVPDKRAGIAALLARGLNDRTAHEMAEAIVAGRPPEGYGLMPIRPYHPDPVAQLPAWLAQADHLALNHLNHDPGIHTALRARIVGHVAERRRAIRRQALANRNLLLDAVLDGTARHGEALVARDPNLRLAWTRAPQALRDRLHVLLAGNAEAPRPGVSARAQHLLYALRGMRRAAPEGFRRVDLSHPVFNPLPPPYRRHWIASQTAVDNAGPDLDKTMRLHRWLDALPAGRHSGALDPHAKEWM